MQNYIKWSGDAEYIYKVPKIMNLHIVKTKQCNLNRVIFVKYASEVGLCRASGVCIYFGYLIHTWVRIAPKVDISLYN
jgi:hypothetical protein